MNNKGQSEFTWIRKNRPAFTLSEVLVTLGIIGVVAAITLPAVLGRIEKLVLKPQIKKAYSMFVQARQKALSDLGYLGSEKLDNFDSYLFNTTVLSNFKIIQTCKGSALSKGCVPKYKGLNIRGCSGFNDNYVYNNQTVYILGDGMILIPYNIGWRSLWLIDVNGKKGPNKAGYDLFEMNIETNTPTMTGYDCLNQDKSIKDGLNNFNEIERW